MFFVCWDMLDDLWISYQCESEKVGEVHVQM